MPAPSIDAIAGRNATRVLRLAPSLRRAYNATIAGLRDNLDVRALFTSGNEQATLERLFSLPEVQALSLTERVAWKEAVAAAGTWAKRDVPYAWARGPFDVTAKGAVDVLQRWESRIFDLQLDVAQNGLRFAANLPWVRAMSLETRSAIVRASIGMGPGSWSIVDNYRNDLLSGSTGNALARQLRDKRSDSTVANMDPDSGLRSETVDRLVTFYTKSVQAWRAQTAIHTNALNAYRVGQQESIDQAVTLNDIDRSKVRRVWIGRDDGKERPTHLQMNNTTVGLDEAWIVPGVARPQMTPGEDEWNCRCTVGYLVG